MWRRTRPGNASDGACSCSCSSSSSRSLPCSRPDRSSSDRLAWPATSSLVVDASASMGATDVTPNRMAAARQAVDRRPARPPRPADGSASSQRARRRESSQTGPTISVGSGRRSRASRRPRHPATSAMRSSSRRRSRLAPATPRSLVVTDAAGGDAHGQGRGAGPGPSRSAGTARTRRSRRSPCGLRRPAVTRSVFVSVVNTDIEPAERRPRAVGRRPAPRDPPARRWTPSPLGRRHRRRAARCRRRRGPPDDRRHGRGRRLRRRARPTRHRRSGVGRRAARPRTQHPPVSAGDPYLEVALSYLPNARLSRPDPGRVSGGGGPDRRHAVGPDHLRGDVARRIAVESDPRHRTAEDERPGAPSPAA